MDNLTQRNYYRIFTGSNQSGGYEKIHLGYEAQTTEISFPKDKETFFHMPFFSSSQALAVSTLVADGAVPGPIPALADRIYKKLGGYGNTTPWGTPYERHDGEWLCSWLYAAGSETPQWLDRYYDPGRLSYKEALEGTANFDDYQKHDPVYYDVPSSLFLEPGVYYKYFHQGEKTAQEIIQTFAGVDKSRLRLNIEDWSHLSTPTETPVDSSIYNNSVSVKNFNTDWVVNSPDPGYQDRNCLSFNNPDFIDCKVAFSETYDLENEFTLSFWVNNPDWSNATSTQLIGNLQRGGFGVFYNNLHVNPYFVIPENTYGHLFYFNQDGNLYNDKNAQVILGTPSNPAFVAINSNIETISLDTASNRILKYNQAGDILTYSKDTDGNYVTLSGEPMLLALSGDNSVVVTTSGAYLFNHDLIYQGIIGSPYGYYEQIAFDTNGNLTRELSCTDIKFDANNQKWVISETGYLYCDNILLPDIPSNTAGTNTNIAIDPENNVWVLAGSNIVYKLNATNKSVIDTFEVGVLTENISSKNISFIRSYDRTTNTFTWYSVIYHNHEKMLYKVTLDGKIAQKTYLPPKINVQDPVIALQDRNLLTFTGRGDFTGYERQRIFNKVFFNNNPQLEFKVAAQAVNRSLPSSIHTLSVPVHYLIDGVWHLVTTTLKNSTISIYIDNYLRDSLLLPGNLSFNYEYKNDLYIGTPAGKTENFNTELNTKSIIWNGYIDSVRVYDYAINPKNIQFLVREKILATNIEWNIPTAPLQYIDVVDRFFKHRLPGSKSGFFNIRLTGTSITNPEVRQRIENDIKLAVQQIKPAYTELLRVEWID